MELTVWRLEVSSICILHVLLLSHIDDPKIHDVRVYGRFWGGVADILPWIRADQVIYGCDFMSRGVFVRGRDGRREGELGGV